MHDNAGIIHYSILVFVGIYLTQYLFLGAQLPFFSGWLDAQGVSERMIGLSMGLALVLRLVLGPILAFQVEGARDPRVGLRLLSFILIISTGMLFFVDAIWMICILSIVLVWSMGCLIPLSDGILLKIDAEKALDYSKIRSLGSFGFIIGTVLVGFLATRYGDNVILYWMIGMAFFLFGASVFMPYRKAQDTAHDVLPRGERMRVAFRLFRSTSFLFMLVASGLAQGSHAVYYYFSELHWSHIGYSSGVIGLLWMVGVVAEICLFMIGPKLIDNIGAAGLLLAGAVGVIVRWPLTGLEPPLWGLFLLQTMHALTYGAIYLGTVAFVVQTVPKHLISTAMVITTSLGIGTVTGLAAAVVGYVFTPENASTAYLMMAGMGGGSFLAALALWKRNKSRPCGAQESAVVLPDV